MLVLVNVTWMFFVAGKENRKAHMKTHKGFKTTLYQVLTNLLYSSLGFIVHVFDYLYYAKNYSLSLNDRKFLEICTYHLRLLMYVIRLQIFPWIYKHNVFCIVF